MMRVGEINKAFYCSAHVDPNDCHGFDNMYSDGCFKRSKTSSLRQSKKSLHCVYCHRKHPTPEQYKEEYGEEYSDDGAVYERQVKGDQKGNWYVTCCGYGDAKSHNYGKQIKNEIVCACTPFGKPDNERETLKL